MTAVVRSSPRTVERPMAFTAWEFIRGALMAWASFTFVFPVAAIVPMLFDGPIDWGSVPSTYSFRALVTVPFSIAAMIIAAPFSLLLAFVLRRTENRWTHGIAFTVLGAIVGAVTILITLGDLSPGFVLPATLTCAAAVGLGRLWTMSRMLAGNPSDTLVGRIERAIDEETRVKDD